VRVKKETQLPASRQSPKYPWWPAPLNTALRVIICIVLVALTWEAAWLVLRPPEYLLPSMHGVILYFEDQWPLLFKHTGVTAYETLLGFASAVVGGIGGAFLLQRFPYRYPALAVSIVANHCKVAIPHCGSVRYQFKSLPFLIVLSDADQRLCRVW
jgi:ABC-type nitrate/sulfonate/bicarbonate transport system permease component